MSIYLAAGIGLMVIGGLLIAVGWTRGQRNSVSANSGSIAIGRDNRAKISNININSNNQPQASGTGGGHGLTIIGIIVEAAGVAVTLWEILHPAAK